MPTLDAASIRGRLEELDALLATAPADQRHVVAQLLSKVGDGLTDIVEAMRAADAGQQLRRDWILEHWPHIVEHHELTKLEAQLPPLAHWPACVSPAGSRPCCDDVAKRIGVEPVGDRRPTDARPEDARSTLDRWRSGHRTGRLAGRRTVSASSIGE